MARIRIEFVPIKPFGLGWLGFDHLQLVFEPDGVDRPVAQDDWLVLEGNSGRTLSGTTLGVPGAHGGLTLAVANNATGAELIGVIGTPDQRGSAVLPVVGDPRQAWQFMAAYAREINDSGFQYCSIGPPGTAIPSVNSSSVIASLLWQIGIDVNDHLPVGIGFSPGTRTLLGTSGNDRMALPEAGFDTLVGGAGDDELSGRNDPARTDKMFGGAGSDIFHWSSGFNIIHGGQPGLAEADDGFDIVDYRGAGIVTVCGCWQFAVGVLPDYVVRFTGAGNGGGIDWLYSIEGMLLDPASDRLVMGAGTVKISRMLYIDMGRPGIGEAGGVADLSMAGAGVNVSAAGLDEIEVSTGAKGCAGWRIAGAERLIGTKYDDAIQMPPLMRVAEGGAGDDIIDARLVLPGLASRRHGYDAEIDGGEGDDVLIACAGRTFARGGSGRNTFVVAVVGDSGAECATELIIADAKPCDRLVVQAAGFDGSFAGAKVFEGRQLNVLEGGKASTELAACGVVYECDGVDLVIRVGGGHETEMGLRAIVRVLNFRRGDLGIEWAA